MSSQLLTVPETADCLRISKSLVRRLYTRGDLRFVRVGNLVRIPIEAIDEMLARGASPEVKPAVTRMTSADAAIVNKYFKP